VMSPRAGGNAGVTAKSALVWLLLPAVAGSLIAGVLGFAVFFVKVGLVWMIEGGGGAVPVAGVFCAFLAAVVGRVLCLAIFRSKPASWRIRLVIGAFVGAVVGCIRLRPLTDHITSSYAPEGYVFWSCLVIMMAGLVGGVLGCLWMYETKRS